MALCPTWYMLLVGRLVRERLGDDDLRLGVHDRMREKLQTEAGRSVYARRKVIVEPPFGQIKEARGFRRFSLRGIAKVRSEWTLVCLTHNLLKLFRAARSEKSIAYATLAAAPS